MSDTKKKTVTKKETATVKKKEKVIVKEEPKKKTAVKKTTKKADIKKNEVLLNETDQKRYHVLSKIIKIFARIAEVVLMIFVPFIFLAMILIPIFFKDFEAESNIVRFNDLRLVFNNDNVTFKIADESYVVGYEENSMNEVIDFLNQHSKGEIITRIEFTLLAVAIAIVIEIFILECIVKIFTNLVNGKSPFTEENTNYIFKTAVLLCILKASGLLLTSFKLSGLHFDTNGVLEILIVFVIYFIFKYGCKLQAKSSAQICE